MYPGLDCPWWIRLIAILVLIVVGVAAENWANR